MHLHAFRRYSPHTGIPCLDWPHPLRNCGTGIIQPRTLVCKTWSRFHRVKTAKKPAQELVQEAGSIISTQGQIMLMLLDAAVNCRRATVWDGARGRLAQDCDTWALFGSGAAKVWGIPDCQIVLIKAESRLAFGGWVLRGVAPCRNGPGGIRCGWSVLLLGCWKNGLTVRAAQGTGRFSAFSRGGQNKA